MATEAFQPIDYNANQPTLKIKAVGAYWNSHYPKEGHYSYNPWISGGDFDDCEYNNAWFMGFGFVWPSSVSLSKIKITGITFYTGTIKKQQCYHEDKTCGDLYESVYKLTASGTQTWNSLPSESYSAVTTASPFTSYAGDRFSKINYNNRASYGAKQTFSTDSISNGASLSAEQIAFYVSSWLSGYSVGTPNYKGTYTTYASYQDTTRDSAGRLWTHSNRREFTRTTVSNPYLIVTYENITSSVTPAYPVGVNIKNNKSNTFSWVTSSTGTPSSGTAVAQTSYKLSITNPSGVTTDYTETTANQYRTFDANTFSVGLYKYKVTATLNTGETLTSNEVYFNVIGSTDAPDITNVTNDAFPTVTWTSTYQDAVEFRLSQNNSVIWESGLVLGADRRSYQLPKMLPDGDYTLELRLLNTYGYYTAYDSEEFTLSTTKPTAPSNICVNVNTNYGIEISGTPASNTTCYVVRREIGSDTIDILGTYSDGFVDYKQKANTYYEYTLRSYSNGFKDGEWQQIAVKIDNVVIHDGRDLKNVVEINSTDSKDFDVTTDISVAKDIVHCLGRKYPVVEFSQWITETKKFNAYVSNYDYARLVDMSCNALKVYYKASGECIACNMEIADRGKYFSGGRLITIELTHIDDEEENQ